MRQTISWHSGCLDEIELVYERAEREEHLGAELEALEKVQDSGMDCWISNREFQVKVYTKEVADLEREIWFLDGKIALLE